MVRASWGLLYVTPDALDPLMSWCYPQDLNSYSEVSTVDRPRSGKPLSDLNVM